MAVLKIKHRVPDALTGHVPTQKYHDDNAISDVVNYILSPLKTPSGYVGGIAVNVSHAINEMSMLSTYYGQNQGIRLRHMTLSFERRELGRARKNAFAAAYHLAYPIAQYYGRAYQIIYAVHEQSGNDPNIHIHFAMNTTNYRTGRKYDGTKKDLYGFLQHINTILEPFQTHVWRAQDI